MLRHLRPCPLGARLCCRAWSGRVHWPGHRHSTCRRARAGHAVGPQRDRPHHARSRRAARRLLTKNPAASPAGPVGPAEPAHRLGAHHLGLDAHHRSPAADRPAGRAGLAPGVVPARLRGVFLQRRDLQRGAGQLPPGDLPAAAARADERRRPLGRLGHAPARRHARRRARHAAGRARHAVDRVRGQLGGGVVALLLPAARAARRPRSRRDTRGRGPRTWRRTAHGRRPGAAR